MRKISITLLITISTIVLSSCSSASRIEPTLTPTQPPTSTPAPTLTPEEVYCNNFNKVQPDLMDFGMSVVDFAELLEKPSNFIMCLSGDTWTECFNFLYRLGPFFVTVIDELEEGEKAPYNDFIDTCRGIEDKGVLLQMALSREEVPVSVKFPHEKIMSCIENASAVTRILADFLETSTLPNSMPDFSSCNQLTSFYEEIENICGQ